MTEIIENKINHVKKYCYIDLKVNDLERIPRETDIKKPLKINDFRGLYPVPESNRHTLRY